MPHGTAVPGTAITYTIVASNSGPTNVSGASIIDALPGTLSGVTYTAVATGGASGFTHNGSGSIDDTSVNMPAGGTITYTVQATIASSATGTLSNAATLTPPAGVTKTANDTANDSDALTPEANLKITKIDSGGGSSITGAVGKAVPGQVFTYTVVVTNTGPSDAAGTSIIDALSGALTGATYTASATGVVTGFTATGSGNIDDANVDLHSGSTITYTVHATITSSATGLLSNTATVTPAAGTTNTYFYDNSATDSDTLTPRADLEITKTDNLGGSSITGGQGTAVPGKAITYTIIVTNAGLGDAAGTSVFDALPSSLTGATYTATQTGGASGFTASGSGSIDDTDVDMPAGSTITYTVHGDRQASPPLARCRTRQRRAVGGATANASLVTGLSNPEGIAISGKDMFVVNSGTAGTVSEYTTAGVLINASLITGLTNPDWHCDLRSGSVCPQQSPVDHRRGNWRIHHGRERRSTPRSSRVSVIRAASLSREATCLLPTQNVVGEYTTAGSDGQRLAHHGAGCTVRNRGFGWGSVCRDLQWHGWRIHHRRRDGQRFADHRIESTVWHRGVRWGSVCRSYNGTVGEYTTPGQQLTPHSTRDCDSRFRHRGVGRKSVCRQRWQPARHHSVSVTGTIGQYAIGSTSATDTDALAPQTERQNHQDRQSGRIERYRLDWHGAPGTGHHLYDRRQQYRPQRRDRRLGRRHLARHAQRRNVHGHGNGRRHRLHQGRGSGSIDDTDVTLPAGSTVTYTVQHVIVSADYRHHCRTRPR